MSRTWAFACACILPKAALAEGPPLRWTVETSPACPGGRDALTRAVELACDAVGGACAIARDGARAERHATLVCGGDAAWLLEVRDGAGPLAFVVDVDGPLEDRMRGAALWVARTERGAPPKDARVRVAPPPAAVPAPSPPPTIAPPPPEPPRAAPVPRAAPSPVVPPRIEAARPEPPRHEPATRGARALLALSGRSVATGGLAPVWLGGRAMGGAALGSGAGLGIAIAGERSLGATGGYDSTLLRAGALVAWGAPWSDDPWGAWLELGALYGIVAAPANVAPSSLRFTHPYAQLAGVRRFGSPGAALRPWIALSVGAHAPGVRVLENEQSIAFLPALSGAVELGLAWAAP